MRLCIALALVLVLATSAFAWEKKAYQMREDFGTEPLYDTALQYYYYIPCPTYSWFWVFTGWSCGDVLGEIFFIGDEGTGGWPAADPDVAHTLEQIRILDFAGYGTVYPELFTVEFCVWCGDDVNCPVGPPYVPLWCSGPLETHFGWNYIQVLPPDGLCLTECYDVGEPFSIVVTAKHIGTLCQYPGWGLDNISTPVETGCIMHDLGCMPAVVRNTTHSYYYGTCYDFEYCPNPLVFCDGRDTTPDCTQFGLIELAWRIYLVNSGPTGTEPSSWGNIKSMYE
jgi:hypothetical protein